MVHQTKKQICCVGLLFKNISDSLLQKEERLYFIGFFTNSFKCWYWKKIHQSIIIPQHVVYLIKQVSEGFSVYCINSLCSNWFLILVVLNTFKLTVRLHVLTKQRQRSSSIIYKCTVSCRVFVNRLYHFSASCRCQLSERKVLSAGLEQGDIKTTACNENPLHGTASQSESSPGRYQNDVSQASSAPKDGATA